MAQTRVEFSKSKQFKAMLLELEHAENLRQRKAQGENIYAPTTENIDLLRNDIARLEAELSYKSNATFAALCRCILNPHGFDNHKFWSQCYSSQLESAMEGLDCCLGGYDPQKQNFLGKSKDGRLHFYACWPKVDDVIFRLSQFMKKDDAIDLINSCCINPAYLIKKDTQLSPTRTPDSSEPKKELDSIDALNGYLGTKEVRIMNPQTQLKQPAPQSKVGHAGLMLKILGGFIAAFGALTIALAFTLAPVSIPTAIMGTACLVTGVGLFSLANNQAHKNTQVSSNLSNITP